jgi:hypothetical protein
VHTRRAAVLLGDNRKVCINKSKKKKKKKKQKNLSQRRRWAHTHTTTTDANTGACSSPIVW